jgi:FMN phosphatase YigB (HAD superfamily)
MTLAIFDLDNTLLGGDSDHAWGEFVAEQALVDPAEHRAKNDQFYTD